MANPNWTKGKSGNPSGRPPKSRALTEILEAVGAKTVKVGDKKVARKRLMAELLWEAVTEGTVTLPSGKVLEVGGNDWWANVQFLYKQIDGPPKSEVDINLPKTVEFDYAKFINTATRSTEDNPAPGEDEGSLHGETLGEDGDGGGAGG